MCGRYALYGPVSRRREFFKVAEDYTADLDEDRYNIAPSQLVQVVRAGTDGGRVMMAAKWGLLPGWVKDPTKVSKPINAKIETAGEKPMFRSAIRRWRVLVPASGFYEWQPVAGGKQPYFIQPADQPFFAFGGIVERWGDAADPLYTVAILTTAANELMAPIHDRMPVIVEPGDFDVWLDPGVTDVGLVREMAGPFPVGKMSLHPVGRAVGNPRAQGVNLINPL